jgi:hypothetical protein
MRYDPLLHIQQYITGVITSHLVQTACGHMYVVHMHMTPTENGGLRFKTF